MPVDATAIFIALAAISLVLALLLLVTYRLVSPRRYVGDWSPGDLGLEYDEISFETEDGLRLSGWWIPGSRPITIVLLHGYSVSRWAFYIRKMVEHLSLRGYNLLAFDFRAHGTSEGRFTTLGSSEILDLRAAIAWLRRERPGESDTVGLVGFSMGGLVAMMGLAEGLAAAGIADSPPIFPDRTGARGLRYFAGLPPIIYPLVKFLARLLTGARTVNALALARKIRRPLLLIVGKDDPLVRVEEVEEFALANRDVNPHVELWTGEGGHVRVMEAEAHRYWRRILNFLARHLG